MELGSTVGPPKVSSRMLISLLPVKVRVSSKAYLEFGMGDDELFMRDDGLWTQLEVFLINHIYMDLTNKPLHKRLLEKSPSEMYKKIP